MNKKIVFIINTEFVLLVSFIYYKLFCQQKQLEPVFIFVKATNQRFLGVNIDSLPGVKHEIGNNLFGKSLFPKFDSKLFRTILNVEKIIWQNPHNGYNHLIFNILKKNSPELKSVIITDSVAVDRKIPIKFIFHTFLKRLYRKILNPWIPLPLRVYTYHSLDKKYNALIAHNNIGYEEFFHTNTLLENITTFKQEIRTLFNQKNDIDYPILFFTQPIAASNGFEEKYIVRYFEIIDLIVNYCNISKLQLYIKVHPGESIENYLKYKSEYVYIDNSKNIPAEIILHSSKDSTVLSMWSSVSVFDFMNKNKHYWLYPLMNYKLESIVKYDNIELVDSKKKLENILSL